MMCDVAGRNVFCSLKMERYIFMYFFNIESPLTFLVAAAFFSQSSEH
jgi:hypothetical protein